MARHTAKSHEPDADQRMVPTGATQVLLCRYHGYPLDRYQHLTAARLVVTGATVRTLVRGLNASYAFPEGLVLCERDDGSKAVAFFRYPDGREVAITVGLMGCMRVSNGRLAKQGDWNTVQRIKGLTCGHPLALVSRSRQCGLVRVKQRSD